MTDIKAVVPRNVYDFIERLREEDPALLSSIAGIGKLAKGREEKEAARWIKINPITYGVGYWGGFIPADENNLEKNNLEKNNLADEIVDDIIENSKKVQEHAENVKAKLAEKPKRKRKRIPPEEVKNE